MNRQDFKTYYSLLNWYAKPSGVKFNNIVRKCKKQLITDLDHSVIETRQLAYDYKQAWNERFVAYATCQSDVAPEQPII